MDTTCQLYLKARRGNRSARDQILRMHMGLVINTTSHFYRPGVFLDFNDLVQQGCLGLLHAIDKFKPYRRARGRRVHFITYAQYWVSHYIRREIQNHGRLIAVPVHRQNEVLHDVVSLDASMELEEDARTRASRVSDVHDTPDNWTRAWETHLLVEELLSALSERKQEIIRCRYGLSGGTGSGSQKQAGKLFGITGARVGHMERAALYTLREAACSIL